MNVSPSFTELTEKPVDDGECLGRGRKHRAEVERGAKSKRPVFANRI